jgi:ureidoglycolate lyase
MESATVPRKILKAKPATPETVAPFGQLLGPNPNIAPLPMDFYGGAVEVRRVVDFVSDEQTELPLVTVNRRPLEVRWMERHFKHTQTFIPLAGSPFVLVVAPPNDRELPDLDRIEALLFDGSAGFAMYRGTWHEFPFALRDDSHLIVILRREATESLKKENVLKDEACGPDLDKKDLQARAQVIYQVEL